MADLSGIVDAITNILSGLEGIKGLPDDPPEQMNQFPFGVVYAGNGEWNLGAPTTVWGTHNIIVELHVARKDLPRDVSRAMVYADSIPKAIIAAHAYDRIDNTVVMLNKIAYEFRALGWGDAETLGFRFTVTVEAEEGIP